MAPQSKQYVELDDFPGLVTNADGSQISPASADICYNLICNRIGEITSRPGFVTVTCEDDA